MANNVETSQSTIGLPLGPCLKHSLGSVSFQNGSSWAIPCLQRQSANNTHVEQANARVHQVDPMRTATEDARESGPSESHSFNQHLFIAHLLCTVQALEI